MDMDENENKKPDKEADPVQDEVKKPRKRNPGRKSPGGGGGAFILFFILGWIVYGGWYAGLKTGLLALLVGLAASLAALIPVGGPIGYYFAARQWIMPIFPKFGLEYTWVTELLFWGGLALSIVINIIVIILISTAIRKKKG
jgi:hypothetical protein